MGLAEAITEICGGEVASARGVGGGCISDAHRVELTDGRVIFVKSGVGLPNGLLRVEAEGLRWLADAKAIRIPEVVGLTEDENFLALEWIEPGSPGATTAQQLGRGLAGLHNAGAATFGWHRDGFIGVLHQRNTPSSNDWPSFWLSHRIEPLVAQALSRRSIAQDAAELTSRLGTRIHELAGPTEPPARLHGDLWSGNLMVDHRGEPWLVDPAAYGGHREVDLAMLHLFGRPEPATVAAYREVSPLTEGWRERLSLWQLEPLLTHTVMFGGGYGAQSLAVLRRFS